MERLTNDWELSDCLSQQTLVITASSYNRYQLLNQWLAASQSTVYPLPACYDYATFTRYLFLQLNRQKPANHPLLLMASQTRLIWQEILLKSTQFFPNQSLIEVLEKAWNLCHCWNLSVTDAFYINEQTEQFYQWYWQFKKQLTALSAITEAEIVPYLIQNAVQIPHTKIIWYGFGNFSWQQEQLQAYFNHQNIRSYRFEYSFEKKTYWHAADSLYHEQTQLIYWIKKQRADNKRVTIVVPNLSMHLQHYKRLIKNYFSDNEFYINHPSPLNQFPLIAHGLSWLGLNNHRLLNQTAKLLLFSPYIKGSNLELSARMQASNHPMLQEFELDYHYFAKTLKSTAPLLAGLLLDLTPYPSLATVSVWIMLFKRRLSELGFPGDYALSNDNKKVYQRFLELLDEFCQLTVIQKSISLEDCLVFLNSLAQSLTFQTGQFSNPIHITNLSESLGLTTDCLWVVGLTNEVLPVSPHFSPFIPVSLQKKYIYSEAYAYKEAEYLISQLSYCASEVIFSYSKYNAELRPQLPCSLISNYPLFSAVDCSFSAPNNLEKFHESYRYPFVGSTTVQGGTAVLSNQAKCPFRAFARHRLHARPLIAVNQGVNLQERGQILHKLLEKVWLIIADQKQLLALDEQKFSLQLKGLIDETFQTILAHRQISLEAGVLELEKNRFNALIKSLLIWERTREPFVVESVEKKYTLTLGKLDFQIRVDRIDKIGEKLCIIDYKSQLPSELPWYQSRPSETQLLMYALLEINVDALMFICLSKDNLQYKGLVNSSEVDPCLKKANQPWIELSQKWHKDLTILAEEFSAGLCTPSPVKTAICARCDYQNLCRLHMNA